jgi:23S rRNA pseudouridine1911/1915/1917 synthase
VKTVPRFARAAGTPGPELPTLAAVVRERTGYAWSRARALCTQGRVSVNGERCLDPAQRLPTGAMVIVDEHAPRVATGLLPANAIAYVDRDIVIVDKPVGMLSIAFDQGDRDTLVDCTRTLLRRTGGGGFDPPLGVVHRLDKETSGLMVFARSLAAKRALAEGFRRHDIERVYHAIVHGAVTAQRVASDLVSDRGDGLRGSHGSYRRSREPAPAEARHAVTHLRTLAHFAGASLVECRLETGRQHQIRIHLAELGHPLAGERVYIRDHTGPVIAAQRPMLHACVLGFVHPRTGQRVSFERAPPEDFAALLATLRGARGAPVDA